MARVEITGLTKRFDGAAAVDKVGLSIADREFLALLGPSGCGKTTLLRLVSGFEVPDEGEISFDGTRVSGPGHAVPPEDRRIGMVFQSYALWPHMNVAQNVGYALKVRRVRKEERSRRVAEALELVGLAGFAERRPAELSGGQRQRVALARCLAMRPGLVLLDEPLANLDPHLRDAMQTEFRRFHAESAATFLYVTHDQSEALSLADRVAVMDAGRLQQIAAPAVLYRQPATRMVARFLGRGMILDGRIVEGGKLGAMVEAHGWRFRARGSAVAGTERAITVKPTDLALSSAGSGLAARLVDARFQGSHVEIRVMPELGYGDNGLLTLEHRGKVPERGSEVHVAVNDAWIIPE